MTFMWWTMYISFMWLLLHQILYKYMSPINIQFIISYLSFHFFFIYLLLYLLLSSESCLRMGKLNLVSDTKLWRGGLRFFIPRRQVWELKIQLYKYFIHLNENQIVSRVFVHVSCIDLGEDIASMFSSMVESNKLYLCVCSNCKCPTTVYCI